MINLIVRNPLNYEVLYEGNFKSLKECVSLMNKEYPHQKLITYYRLHNNLYIKKTHDWIDIKVFKKEKDKSKKNSL